MTNCIEKRLAAKLRAGIAVLAGILVAGRTPGQAQDAPKSTQDKSSAKVAAKRVEFSQADSDAIKSTLEKIGPILKAKQTPELTKLTNPEATAAAIERQRLLPNFDAATKEKLVIALRTKMAQGLIEAAENAGWTDLVVRHIRVGESPTEAIATIRARTAEGPQARLRVWLAKSANGWKLVDWEDDELPIRMSTVAGMLFPAEGADGDAARRGFPFLVQAAQCASDGDMENATKMLAKVEKTRFPPSVDAFRWLLRGLTESSRNRLSEALQSFERAEKLGGDIPSAVYHRAIVHVKLNEIDRTLQLANEYLERFGADAEVMALMGDALVDLGRPAEAMQTYRKGLAEDPASVPCLVGLSQILPKSDRSEIASRFSKLKEATTVFPDLAEHLVEERDDQTLDQVIAAHRKLAPTDVLNDYFAAEALILRESYDAAAKILKSALPNAKDDELRQQFGDRIIETLLLAKKPLEAYGAAPESKRAFRAVGEQLVNDERADILEQLIDRHRKRSPADLWLPYFVGELRTLRKQFDEADKAFVEGMKAPIDEPTRSAYRSARVAALFQAGKAVEALRDIGPEKDTFDQLAPLAAKADQDVLLQKLIDMHAKKQPDDADLGLWDAEVLWLRRDFAGAAETLRKHRLPISGRRSSGKQFIDRMVRSLLRSGQQTKALEEAQVYEIRERDPFYVAVALSGDKSVDGLFEAIQKCLRHGYELDDLRNDPDIGRAMRAPKLQLLLQRLQIGK